MAGHVFLSHSTHDDPLVAKLRGALEQLGYSCWTDSRQLTAGDQLEPEIRKAIAEASHLVALLSVHAANSPWMSKEIELGLERMAEGFKVIPVLVPPLETPSLRLFFPDEEPYALRFDPEKDQMTDLLADLRSAFGDALPTDPELTEQPEAAPMAELVVDLAQLGIEEERPTAMATLRWRPAEGAEGTSQQFKVKAPIGVIEMGELAWYLERYSSWPGKQFRRRAREVESSLKRWGEELFRILDTESSRKSWEDFRGVPAGVERCISIYVDPEPPAGVSEEEEAVVRESATRWLGLPWELLRDEDGYLAEGARGARVRRRLPRRGGKEPVVSSVPVRVLVVSPRPEDDTATYIDHRVSVRPLVEAFARLGERAEVELLGEPTLQGLSRALKVAYETGEPFHAVHFDGHGVYDRRSGLGALCFESAADQEKLTQRGTELVGAEKLAETLRDHRVPLIVLEACQTAMAEKDPMTSVAGQLLAGGVASVVAMSHAVLVETARRFVNPFYEQLSAGATVGKALLEAQSHLREDTYRGRGFLGDLNLQDWFVPVLYQERLDPQLVREVPGVRAGEEIQRLRAAAVEGLPDDPDHGFVGRSRELLAVERLLVRERHAVLLGEGGEGKTTLAVELARWLVKSQRFERAAFVSVESGLAQSARAVLSHLGGQLVPNFDASTGGDFERGFQAVERALRERDTLVVLDNMESLLEGGLLEGDLYEPEVLEGILGLMERCLGVGATRLVFTSRSPLPAPFAQGRNVVRLGRLGKQEAIAMVGEVLKSMGAQPVGEESEEDVEALVDAAGCHARSLVLLAREVAVSGVHGAAQRMGELMERMAARYPDDRERSLFASVGLSLRRLPEEVRGKLRPLGVFQGGGHGAVIAQVLGLDYQKDEEIWLGNQLVEVGLAEWMPYNHLRLHPALGPVLLRELDDEEREAARDVWVEAMVQLTAFLYQQRNQDPKLAAVLTLLELPNLLAALDALRVSAGAEQVVGVATDLEGLLQYLDRPRALAHLVSVREEVSERLGDWNRARSNAEQAAIDRLLEAGRFGEAVQRAQGILQRATAAGESAYEGAAYDLARAFVILGRALRMGGAAGPALQPLREARERFGRLAARGNKSAERMAPVCLADQGDCLRALGRLDEAVAAYEESIELAEKQDDPRQVATSKGQLGTVWMLQKRHADALAAHREAQQIFEDLGEPGMVAVAWHQIGRVHEEAGQLNEAEQAYQRSLAIKIRRGDRQGEATSLNQLGNVYGLMGRPEEAVRFYRDAAAVLAEIVDVKNEGFARSNAAILLMQLDRHAEARHEILRAIECDKPFGHAAEPWKTFSVLHNLELALGNDVEAAHARQQALDTFLAYRRAGGENHSPGGQLVAGVGQAIVAGEVEAMREMLGQIAGQEGLPEYMQVLVPALQQILKGSRDPSLAEDPRLDYDDAVELQLLLEALAEY